VHLLLLFAAALLLSSVLTHYVRNTALKYAWTCTSPRQRDLHGSPIPRLGGVAIAFSFLPVVVGYIAFYRLRGISVGFGIYTTFAVLAPAVLMFILGLYDDLKPISAWLKFTVQAIAGVLLYYGGIRIYFFPIVAGTHELHSAISAVLTVMWVLLISNAFNLIDGLDGLSTGSALFSTLVVFIVSLISGNAFVSVMTIVLAGAMLGFLRYNFNPATIFLGDCGSMFLGFMLSAVSLAGAQKGTTAVAVAIPIVSFGLPLLDTFLSVARRFLSGQPLFSADREHIHHKLLKRGFTHKQAVVMLYGVSAVLGLVSLLLLYPTGSSIGIVLFVVGLGIWLGVQHLGYHEFAEIGRAAKRTVDQKHIIVNNLAIRRATEELSSTHDFDALCAVLRSAFQANDFDGFELRFKGLKSLAAPQHFEGDYDGDYRFEWRKPSGTLEPGPGWRMTLDLKGSRTGQEAAFTVYRGPSAHNLLFDVNLLTNQFQVVLADAFERALTNHSRSLMAHVAVAGASLNAAVTASPQ
jgi:UDP-GlcNAc:undecaprenyl-phosphate GlcNAc-1-phosphate transferase